MDGAGFGKNGAGVFCLLGLFNAPLLAPFVTSIAGSSKVAGAVAPRPHQANLRDCA
jgi:hypothetical protein